MNWMEWISVKDVLPNNDEEVLIVYDGSYKVAWFDQDNKNFLNM